MANYEKGPIVNAGQENLSTIKYTVVENEAGYNNGDVTNVSVIKLDDGYHMKNGDEVSPTVLRVREYEPGKQVILLEPNAANRRYLHVDKMVTDEVVLTYKAPVKIGAVGSKTPNEKQIAYLNDEQKAEYLAIIDEARAKMAAAVPTELTEQEKLEKQIAKLTAKLNGETYHEEKVAGVSKNVVDYIADDKYDRYNELLDIAAENKKNTPRKVPVRGPMTDEQKKKMAEGKLAKLQAKLDAMMAGGAVETPSED